MWCRFGQYRGAGAGDTRVESCYTFNEPWPGCSQPGRGNTVTGYYRSFNSDVISDLLGHQFEDEQAGPEVQAEFLPKQVL